MNIEQAKQQLEQSLTPDFKLLFISKNAEAEFNRDAPGFLDSLNVRVIASVLVEENSFLMSDGKYRTRKKQNNKLHTKLKFIFVLWNAMKSIMRLKRR
jgi:hypothetical protein